MTTSPPHRRWHNRKVSIQTRTVQPAEPETPAEPTPPTRPAPRPSAGLVIGGGILPAPLLADLITHGATLTPLITPGPDPEPHYRPSARLATYVRLRDLTCRHPGCDRPAITADIDHTSPWPYGSTHAGNTNTRCRRHHLLKTFWPGWTNTQHPDGTLTITTPTGHTYPTKPGSALLFPAWDTTTEAPPTRPVPPHSPDRGLMMPRRKTTRAKARQYRIQHERNRNHAHLAERNKPPPI